MKRLISTSTRVMATETQRKGTVSEILKMPTDTEEGRVMVLLDEEGEEGEFNNDALQVLNEKT